MNPKRHLGVLLVHGIGSQAQGRTLADWGQALVAWINRWTQSGSQVPPTATISDAFLPPRDSGPAHAFVDVYIPGPACARTSNWIVAEAWWASTVLTPSFSELARWAFVVVPSTIASHFLIRLRRSQTTIETRVAQVFPNDSGAVSPTVARVAQVLSYLLSFFSLAAAMVAMPFLILALALILLLGLIPISRVQELAGTVQRALANTLGDSLALLGNAVQEAAIVGGVRRDLEWLSEQCDKVVVIAHSQGAAVAHLALERTTASNVTRFVTFGSGIAKLLETRRLMSDVKSERQWVPWGLSLGAALLFVGLSRALPGLWAILDNRMLLYLLAYFVFAGLASLPTLPRWLFVALLLLATFPFLLFWWTWLDYSTRWLFMVIGGFVLLSFSLGKAAVGTTELKEAFRPESVNAWLDLYGSRDPVPNGAFFESDIKDQNTGERKGYERSEEVMVLRSTFSDHTAYWASTEDFVPHVIDALAGEAGLRIKDWRNGDADWLKRSRTRRRWRTATLAFVRTAMFVAPVVIIGTQGVSVARQSWQPTAQNDATPIGVRIQNVATEAVLDVAGTVTPDVVKRWTGSQGAATDSLQARAATGAASLTLLGILTWLVFRLIVWRWRAWDRAEVDRFFERQSYEVLELPFVVFLFATVFVFEIVVFVALGWVASLRTAPTPLLRLILVNTGTFIIVATSPWLLKFGWSCFATSIPVASGVLARGLGAAVIAVLAVLPAFVGVATTLVGLDPGTLNSSHFIEPAGWAIGAILVVLWGVPLFKLWPYVERRVARWTGAGADPGIPAASLSLTTPTHS